MYRSLRFNTLIGQERRAIKLFLILLLSVILIFDYIIIRFVGDGIGLSMLLPYLFLYLLIPVAFFLNKKDPKSIKYFFFWGYLIVCFIAEMVVFWNNSTGYSGGNLAEVFFILFSPIFIDKKYYHNVVTGIIVKYLLAGFLLQDMVILLPIALILIFAIIAYIILNRFIQYIAALNDSYNKQFELTLSSGMAIMNHTIKNEITKIQYLNSRMKDSIRNQDTQELDSTLNSIQQATNHMLSMSNRLQEKTGEITLQEGAYSLSSILRSAVSMIEPNLQKNNVQICQEYSTNDDILCDQLQLQEALMNILMNAVESMGLKDGIVTLRLLKVKKELIIEIEDTGCGIPSDIRSRVFEPFFTTRSTLNNHGLGLSYCYSVIEKHGGTMDIHSEINVGTKVIIRLPSQRIVHMQKSDRDEVAISHEQDKGLAG